MKQVVIDEIVRMLKESEDLEMLNLIYILLLKASKNA